MDLKEALSRPEAYPHRPDDIELHETHVSLVFVAGDLVYKVKKPLRLPFLDYSTLELRRRFCEEEVRLNRRLAPDTYLGVAPITADLRVRGEGDVVEYAVEMRRLDGSRMLDRLLAEERVTGTDVDAIADRLAEFHAGAERAPGDAVRVQDRIEANLDNAARFLPPVWRDRVAADQESEFARLSPLLAARDAVDGHGDLHAGNVCLPDGRVVMYDCIEFDPAFRLSDRALDVSFLAMDLERHGAWELAGRFVDRYIARSADPEIRPLLSLFKRDRAVVRGLVGSLHVPPLDAARGYFRLAVSYGLDPFLLLTCGLPGTGKSTLARAFAKALGARIVSSDLVRKELAGIPATQRWTGGYLEGPYDPALTRRTYETLRDHAADLLAAGESVVVDATFRHREQRDLLRALPARCLVVHLDLDEEVVRARLAARAAHPGAVSDADFEVYRKARAEFEPPRAPDVVHRDAPERTLDLVVDRLLA